ncbi:MAG: LamG-like jellyroll fold domain-containing protein, partial [Planctomycetota bacterium]
MSKWLLCLYRWARIHSKHEQLRTWLQFVYPWRSNQENFEPLALAKGHKPAPLENMEQRLLFTATPVAEWLFEDGLGTDTSVNSHTGTLVADAAIVTNDRGGLSLGLDGDGDRLDVADSTLLNLATHSQRSVSLWFKADDASISNRKQVLYEEGGGTRGLSIYLHDGKLYVGGWNTPTDQSGWLPTFVSTTSVESDRWHHVVLRLDGNSSIQPDAMKAYLDGVEFGSDSGSQLWARQDDLGIGDVEGETQFHDGLVNDTTSHGFAGEIDNLRVFNQALTPAEVQTLFDQDTLSLEIDFSQYTLTGITAQDQVGTSTVEDAGSTLRLIGNRWQAIDIGNYAVTANTVLEFDFTSSSIGEIHGIGFDVDTTYTDSVDGPHFFKLYGTQTDHDFESAYHNYDPVQGVSAYKIPVGQFFSGIHSKLVFVMDHDVVSPTGESVFSNVKLYEASAAPIITSNSSEVSTHEGQQAVISGTYYTPAGALVGLSASVGVPVDHGDGTWTWTYTPQDAASDTQAVSITATDTAGATTELSFGLVVHEVPPASLVVSNFVDELDNDYSAGDFSLREAVYWAGMRPGQDVITFDTTLLGSGTITLDPASAQLSLDDDTTIQGPGASLLTIDANGIDRAFVIQNGTTVTFSGLAIEGAATNGVFNDGGDLTISDSVIAFNGAAYGESVAILNYGDLTILGSTIHNNQGHIGGAIYHEGTKLHVHNSTISNNTENSGLING